MAAGHDTHTGPGVQGRIYHNGGWRKHSYLFMLYTVTNVSLVTDWLPWFQEFIYNIGMPFKSYKFKAKNILTLDEFLSKWQLLISANTTLKSVDHYGFAAF